MFFARNETADRFPFPGAPSARFFLLLTFLPWLTGTFGGCAVVEIKEAPAYHFSRSILNIAMNEPVEREQPSFNLQASNQRTSAPSRVTSRTSPGQRSGTRVAKRPKLQKLIPRSKPYSTSEKRCTGRHCSEPRFVTAARRLFGLRMKTEHAFMQHVTRVSDVIVKPRAQQNFAAAVLEHIRLKGSFEVQGKPRAGDLVFFHGTTAGSAQDGARPSLVGVVERIDSHGTVFFLAQVGDVVDRSRCTPSKPHIRRDEKTGRVLNSFMRHKRRDDASDTAYMAGELLIGFGRI
jgi:hypothetical protein